MKQIFQTTTLNLLIVGLLFNSCKKETRCEDCQTNQPVQPTSNTNKSPIAIAGTDQTIIFTLPTDSILLNGSGSSDPDGKIAAFLWTQISGPSSSNIVNENSVQAMVTNLAEGVYQFELTVTDSLGFFDKDTTTVRATKLYMNEIIFTDQIWYHNYTSFIIIPDLNTHLPAGVFFKVFMKRDNTNTWHEVLQTNGLDFGFHIDNGNLWIMSLTGSNESDTPDIKIIY